MFQKFREYVDQLAKPWKAKKAEVLQFWRNLKPNLPIQMMPVPESHKGTRFRADGLRITGTPQFINSILSRIQDLIVMESDDYRLDVEYRQIESKVSGNPQYVFYVHLIKDEDEPKTSVD